MPNYTIFERRSEKATINGRTHKEVYLRAVSRRRSLALPHASIMRRHQRGTARESRFLTLPHKSKDFAYYGTCRIESSLPVVCLE
jgi:hypothetical protein